MSASRTTILAVTALGALAAVSSPLQAGRELPDALMLNVGTLMRQDSVGGEDVASLLSSNVTVVLTGICGNGRQLTGKSLKDQPRLAGRHNRNGGVKRRRE